MSKVTQYSFSAGELAPELYARTDVSKYAIGLKTLKNGFVKVGGGISNRAGLEFVCETKNSNKASRLIPFAFNTTQTYIIEAGDLYLRYIMDGGQIIDSNSNIIETTTTYAEADLHNIKYAQNADVLTLCHPSYMARELSRASHTSWSIADIAINPTISAPTGLTAIRSGSADTTNTTTFVYVVTAVKGDTYEESLVSSEVSVVSHIEGAWVTGEKITLSWTAVTGATEYNIYRSVNGVYAYSGTSKNTSFIDNNINPDLTSTAPIFVNPFASAGNYPSTINYFQSRRVFANTTNKPQTLFATQTNMYNNFNVTRPLVATDGMEVTINEREVNAIKHIIAMNDLVLLTSGGEWRVNGSDGIFEATPPPVAKLQSNYGCSDVMPLVSGNMILFIQAGGYTVRDLGYTYVSDSYAGSELSYLASHLFEGKTIVDWAYSKEPNRIIWAVMSDGTVNGLTYNKEQEILGWHKHETDGKFESVAVIREGNEDVPYFIVNRTINGKTKRYIERMKSRVINNAIEGFFVDCGLTQTFSNPVNTISGLDFLEGKEVVIVADGGVIEGKVVTNGSVSLGEMANVKFTASTITVGLPYTFDLETLNIESENTQGSFKILNSFNIKVDKTREDFDIIGNDGMVQTLENRFLFSINDASKLYSGDLQCVPNADPSTGVTVHIQQPRPLPITVLSLTPNVEVTG